MYTRRIGILHRFKFYESLLKPPPTTTTPANEQIDDEWDGPNNTSV